MKPQLLANARRPVRSAPAAKSARVLPARACFARKGAPKRLAVRGSALPGRDVRRRSPPTAAEDDIVNISMLVAWPSIRRSGLGSYGDESVIQTLRTGILLVYRHNRLCAIARDQMDIGRIGLIAPKFDRTTNRRMSLDNSPHEWVKCTASELAGAAALCCQGSAPASPPPLTAAAFRLVLRLGFGFGKTKAGLCFRTRRIRHWPCSKRHLPEMRPRSCLYCVRALLVSLRVSRLNPTPSVIHCVFLLLLWC